MKTCRWMLGIALLVALAACGGGGTEPSAPPAAAESTPAAASSSSAPAGETGGATGSATVTGKISFEGTAPKQTKINMNADAICIKNHPEPAFTENVVVNANNTLKYVFVYVKSGAEGKTYPVPTEPAILDQRGCHYMPHVWGMRAGQPLKIVNSDGTLHNVHALPKVNQQFNAAMPKNVKEITKGFAQPEMAVKFQCEVHNWMTAWCHVMSHPFFAVSGDDGSYEIKGLPPGKYTIEAWHEKYGTQTQEVTITGSESVTADFAFKAS